jgi:site-specific recombinase XerD
VQYEAPEQLAPSQEILGIPFKRTAHPTVGYLAPDALQALLAQPDRSTADGRRDAALLTLLYDTGARVQELIDLLVRNIRIEAPAVVTLTGKGRKTRQVPLMTQTVRLVADYLTERRLVQPDRLDHPVFYNRQRQKLTRVGVTYILSKYVRQAQAKTAVGFPARVTPHVLRHTKAMHLVQADVNLIYIRDLLGHSHVTTTEVYARADAERKRQALAEATRVTSVEEARSDWTENPDLMQWLRQVCAPAP